MNDIAGSLGMNIVEDCLILSVPDEIDNDILELLKNNVLQKITANSLKGMIIDFSSLAILDSYEYNEFLKLIKMIKLFGLSVFVVGLQPGIVSALIDMDVDTDGLLTFLNLEEGLNAFRIQNGKEPEIDENNDERDDINNDGNDEYLTDED